MIKTLLKSVREFKFASIITPLLVFFEVILECIIPFVIAEMVELIETHETVNIYTVLEYGAVVVLLAVLDTFSATASTTASAPMSVLTNLMPESAGAGHTVIFATLPV